MNRRGFFRKLAGIIAAPAAVAAAIALDDNKPVHYRFDHSEAVQIRWTNENTIAIQDTGPAFKRLDMQMHGWDLETGSDFEIAKRG